jgi:death on curing protein
MSSALQTLTAREVEMIHAKLVDEFSRDGDPISPPGVKSPDMLESAVFRQHTGIGSQLKYPDAVSNAATLVFGICCDHPFHNGNKRTALVCMLVHLDKNGLCLFQTSQADLYSLLLEIASHRIGQRVDPRRKPEKLPKRWRQDDEVEEIARWIRKRVDRIRRGERLITYRSLRQILGRFGFVLENPRGNSIDIVKIVEAPPSFFRRFPKVESRRIGTVGYRDEGTEVSFRDIKHIRRLCQLTEEDGVDRDAFYSDDTLVDSFVNRYRTLLRRLART